MVNGSVRASNHAGRSSMKDLESLDAAFVIDTFLLLLIGIGPESVNLDEALSRGSY